jgi:hypothetical protein
MTIASAKNNRLAEVLGGRRVQCAVDGSNAEDASIQICGTWWLWVMDTACSSKGCQVSVAVALALARVARILSALASRSCREFSKWSSASRNTPDASPAKGPVRTG